MLGSARLRNIQETEKAKRAAAEEKLSSRSGVASSSTQGQPQGNRPDNDEARLAATRCTSPTVLLGRILTCHTHSL